MSDLLNKASLVVIPSGYKEDTVYSVVPSDGSGDLSFTRASNGTRVNSAGLVEVCPWNLASYSEDFANAYWDKPSATITSNTTTNPINGATNADTITGNGYISKQIASNGVNTFSIYTKANTATEMRLNVYDGVTDRGVYYNLSTGQITSSYGTIIASSIESVGNGWYKISITTNNATFSDVQIHRDSSGTAYIWGAQLNIGSTAKPYFPTTDRLNVPRLTYQNGAGGCPSLLLEKQSTNIALNSENFTATWIPNGAVTITANTTTSPDGTQNADTIAATGAFNGVFQAAIGVSNATQYTFSLYVKNISAATSISIGVASNPSSANINFNAVTGTINSVGASITASSVTNVGNGWYRLSGTYTTTGTSNDFIIYSTGAMSFAVWGAQLEASSYPTSYIPTTSASATRVADACYKTGISSLIGQTEGTLFFELQRNDTDNDTRLQISDGSGINWLFVSIETGLNPRAYCNVGGVNQFSVYGSAVSNSTHKVALAYKSNDFKVYIDGVAVITQTSGSVPACNRIDVGSGSPNGPVVSTSLIKEVVLFPTRLTNAELAQLTA